METMFDIVKADFIEEVIVYQGPLYHIWFPEDPEPSVVADWFVGVALKDGKHFAHHMNFRHQYNANQLAEKIRNAKEINLDHWYELLPYDRELEEEIEIMREYEEDGRSFF
jgi:hypothetical protein